MQNVLADLCLESEAATALSLRLARAYDEGDHALRRVGTAVAKYWICKRGPRLAFEAMECLGGNGYVEDATPLARIYREMPVNSIWEGSGNVNALDVLRALRREPALLEAVLAETRGVDRRIDDFVAGGRGGELDEWGARHAVERIALALQAALLVRHAPAYVSDAFLVSRLGGDGGREYGTLPRGVDAARIVARHTPWPDA